MFTQKDFEEIDKRFQVVTKTGLHIILKSLTGHTWDIYSSDAGYGCSLVISHKHNDSDPFHIQPNIHPRTVAEAMEYIRSHDRYEKDKRKRRS